jgi:acyl-coenzyme A thioesterase 13
MLEIPAGFGPLFRSSPFTDLIGPIYSHGAGETLVLGLRIEAKHGNSRGLVHGGVFATVADVALGYALASSTNPPSPYVTANLSIDYAGTAAVGDWLESRVDIQRKGSRLAFANCYLSVGDKRIVRASAVFALTG